MLGSADISYRSFTVLHKIRKYLGYGILLLYYYYFYYYYVKQRTNQVAASCSLPESKTVEMWTWYLTLSSVEFAGPSGRAV